MKTTTAQKTTPAAPKLPSKSLDVTDPKRKLTRDEWKGLTKEQKRARKAARSAQRGPAKQRFVKLVLRYAGRFERFGKLFEKDQEIAKSLASLVTDARGVASDIDELPESWMPAGKVAKHNFTAGMRVVLSEAKAKEYAETLGEEVGELEILNAVGRRVVCKAVKGGVRFFLEARHIKEVVKA